MKGLLYWLFVDSKSRVVSHRLLQKEAEEFIRNLRNVNIDQWWAWNPSFRDWLPLKNIVDFREGKVRLLIQLPEDETQPKSILGRVEKEKTVDTHIPTEYSEVREYLREEPADEVRDFHGDDITFSKVPKPPALGLGADRRRSTRIDKRIEVLVATRGKSFRAHSVNISLNGVMLEKALPFEIRSGPFEIVFIVYEGDIKRQLVFQGKVSGDLKDRRRLVFGELSPANERMLEDLFAA